MATTIQSTASLHMDLDERVYSEEIVAEIKNAYADAAPAEIKTHAPGKCDPKNTLILTVEADAPYWTSSDGQADETWENDVMPWLADVMGKVSTATVTSNYARRENDEPELDFRWLGLELEESSLVIKLTPESALPERAIELVDRARTFMREGAFSQEGVSRISIPSCPSYIAQTVDFVDYNNAPQPTGNAQSYTANQPADYPTDYTVWGIEYEDGTERGFDSVSGSFAS